ncbi:ATP-binding protein [Candidatus Manganitrophus noduliformans]|uniref:histidine kinase n=1 Tax=Candidatus Manganitrophus noduliformans TaxID=2606439 RepID=A0A7X6DTV2_9BACT|nr:ATP-binding protein [Candidatus Manganitrophus noduliformans]NKE73244.1 response regulator [Candidatus Manganitrophus noduliformans]
MPQVKEGMNILLVDDHPENLLALEAVLDVPEYRLVRAQSGMEALRLLLKESFSLILLDVHMPGLNGYETAALIRERPKTRDIPIIFITAVNKSEEDVEKGYSVGAVDYIIKPFDPESLKAKVAILTGLHKKEELSRPAENLPLENTALSPQPYRNLTHAIPQIVWIAQPDGAVDFFNQPWFNYTGLSFEQSEGWGWTKVIHPEDHPSAIDQWTEALRGEKEYQMECRLKRADGAYRWHLYRASPERDSQGRVLAWLGTATDVNDQKQGQEKLQGIIEELEQKKKEAEAATRLKSEFVSNVSHELRTPLNAILGYASLVLEGTYGEVPESLKGPVDGIQRNAFELLELINNLLDLSKMESGQMPIAIAPVDLRRLLPEAAQKVAPLLSGKKVAVKWRIADNLKNIQSDPLKIRQIFMNLLSNAIKFTEEGSIAISAVDSDGGILLSIEDTGIGIREEDLPVIFDAFRQIDGSATREAGGSGLGLTIVKKILEVLQGRIEVRSKPGKGSTFTIFLPEDLPNLPKPISTPSGAPSANPDPASLEKSNSASEETV